MKVLLGAWLVVLCAFQLRSADIALDPAYGEFVPGKAVEFALDPSTVGCSVKGLPSGLKFVKASGVIRGAAKKGPDVRVVEFTKKIEGKSVSATTLFKVARMPTVSVALVGAEDAKIKGAKAYCAGKKVSLSVKVPKGYVFQGWLRGSEPFPDAASCVNPKLKFTMPESDLDLTAWLRAEEVVVECDDSWTCELKQSVTIPIAIDSESPVKSVKVKGLPSGLKYNKTANAITGAAKKAGTFGVSITVRTKAGSEVVRTMRIDVNDQKASAIGQYAGTYAGDTVTEYSWGEQEPGTVSFTIKADGKITGSYIVDGTTTHFSGTVGRIDAEGCLIAEVSARVDGHKVTFLIEAMPDGRAWFSGAISAEERMYTEVLKKVR